MAPLRKIKYLRVFVRDLTQPELAQKASTHGRRFTRELVSAIETGRINPTPEELECLAKALNYSPASKLMDLCAIPDPDDAEVSA